MAHLRIGTRTSKLALWQTEHVAERLVAAWPGLTYELRHMTTQGDRRLDRPLPEIGGKGLFTAELEEALRRGEIDLAVHSLKDLPVEDAEGLTVAAILPRADVRDVLIAPAGMTLATLPSGAVVGTSSLRRQAQTLAVRPDLVIKPIRGNVDTRLRKVAEGEYMAAIMAAAGLTRLGLETHIAEWLSTDAMLPAPGQGAIAVQCRRDDTAVSALLAGVDDAATRVAATAERRLLTLLGGGCSAPVAALAVHDANPALKLAARVLSVDGARMAAVTVEGATASDVADAAALALFAQGAGAILAERQAQVSPLCHKCIVITRPANQAVEFAAGLAFEGATPFVIPAIRTVAVHPPASMTQAELARYDWILFTSANAVRHFSTYLARDAHAIRLGVGQAAIAAVGSATAAALATLGVRVDAVPAEFTGAALADTLPNLAGKQVLLPRSALGGDDLPQQLAARGAVVTDLPIYTTVAAPLSSEDVAQIAARIDAVTFTSGSAVRGLLESLRDRPDAAAALARTCIACIGPSTAAVAVEHGLQVDVIAQPHTTGGLVAGLRDYFRQRG
jgi:hydroxymethylbilane synthase